MFPLPLEKNGRQTGEKLPKAEKAFKGRNQESYRNTEQDIIAQAKHNITKPTDVLATSWSCHLKKRCLVDPLLHSKLILQIGF